jgi:hypothetical protein
VIIVLVLGITAFVFLNLSNQKSTQAPTQPKSNSSVLYEKQADEKGSVVVEATPISLIPEKNTSFTLIFTTHSGDLNYDIATIAKLTDNKGNIYNPISWTGGSGGHHLEGVLTFPKISEGSNYVILKIPGIDNLDRIFTWDLE